MISCVSKFGIEHCFTCWGVRQQWAAAYLHGAGCTLSEGEGEAHAVCEYTACGIGEDLFFYISELSEKQKYI